MLGEVSGQNCPQLLQMKDRQMRKKRQAQDSIVQRIGDCGRSQGRGLGLVESCWLPECESSPLWLEYRVKHAL